MPAPRSQIALAAALIACLDARQQRRWQSSVASLPRLTAEECAHYVCAIRPVVLQLKQFRFEATQANKLVSHRKPRSIGKHVLGITPYFADVV